MTSVMILFVFFVYQVVFAQNFSVSVMSLKYLLLIEVSLFD